MRKYFGTVIDTAGNVIASASVTVYTQNTTTKATLYSDDGSTLITNPVTSDSKGGYSFYVTDGIYDLTVSGSNLTSYTIEDVTIRDPVGLTAVQTVINKTLTSPKINFATAAKTTTYTVVTGDFIIHCDDSAGSFTLSLPSAALFSGRIFVIGKSVNSSYTITIDGYSSETIGGVAQIYLYLQNDYIAIQSDGTNWRVLSKTWEEIVWIWSKSGNLDTYSNRDESSSVSIDRSIIFTYLLGRIISIYAYVRTPPTGASIIFDVNKNDVTIYTTQANRPTIAVSNTRAPAAVPDITSLKQDDRLDLDCDQVGSDTRGADATVILNLRVQGRYLS